MDIGEAVAEGRIGGHKMAGLKWDPPLFDALWDARIELLRALGYDAMKHPLVIAIEQAMQEMDASTICRDGLCRRVR